MHEEAAEELARDPQLGPVVDEYGPLELTPPEDVFERFVVSIVRQQVSMDAAAAIRDRLFQEFEVTPKTMLAADPDALRNVGLSAAKVEYVKAAAEVFVERGYDSEYFAEYTDDEVLAELTDIHGIGPWTAKMFLLFCLCRPDVFPVEDLGIRQGMHRAVGPDMPRAEMATHAERWSPYRSYASLYLWRVTDE